MNHRHNLCNTGMKFDLEEASEEQAREHGIITIIRDSSEEMDNSNNVCNIGVKYNFKGTSKCKAREVRERVDSLAREHGRKSIVMLRGNGLADEYHGFLSTEQAVRFCKSLAGPGVSHINFQGKVIETNAPTLYVTYPTTPFSSANYTTYQITTP